jgi:PilZ domain
MNMDERRASRRQKSFLRGVVYFDKRRSEMACLIRDLSEDGARIILSRTVAIPDLIELHIPQRELTVSAHVQWRRADETGLAFRKAKTATSPREDQLIKRVAELEAEIGTLQRTIKQLKRAKTGESGDEAA